MISQKHPSGTHSQMNIMIWLVTKGFNSTINNNVLQRWQVPSEPKWVADKQVYLLDVTASFPTHITVPIYTSYSESVVFSVRR